MSLCQCPVAFPLMLNQFFYAEKYCSMKLRHTFKYFFLAMALLYANACTDGFEEMNTNPNEPTAVDPAFLLPNALRSTMDRYWGFNVRNERINIDHAMSWVGYFTRNIYENEGDNYNVQPSVNINNWQGFYVDAANNFQQVIKLSAPGGARTNTNYEGIGLTMRTFIFSLMTDIWGAIPYSEALKGASAEPIFSPGYDSQQEVYAALIEDLKVANSKLVVGGPTVRGDIMFNGNIMMWKRFANSLRFKLLNRQAHKVAGSAAEMRAMLADPATYPMITSNSENIRMVYGTVLPDVNPWHRVFIQDGRTDWNISSTIIDKLKAMNDTRLGAWFSPGPDAGGEIVGHPNGLPGDIATPFLTVSAFLKPSTFMERNSPAIVMTYAELLFIQAEAALDGDIIGDAQALYEAAIAASFAQYGLTVPSGYEMGAATKENIMTQKWIALFGQGIEAWTELRRTGFPVLPAADPRAIFMNDGVLPTRLTYPGTEYSLNNTSLQTGIQKNGGPDNMKVKMWWAE